MIQFEIPDHATIPFFKRQSMGLHALKDIGFADVTHSLLSTGNFLTIRRADSAEQFQSVPLINHGRSDYVRVKLYKPTTGTLSSPQVKNQGSCGMTHQTVARLDLAKTFSGTTLYALEHFRYGCPGGAKAQTRMTGKPPPEDFHCPLCMQEKMSSLGKSLFDGDYPPPHWSTFTARSWFLQICLHSWFHMLFDVCGIADLLSLGIYPSRQKATHQTHSLVHQIPPTILRFPCLCYSNRWRRRALGQFAFAQDARRITLDPPVSCAHGTDWCRNFFSQWEGRTKYWNCRCHNATLTWNDEP
jgi:hypothetical protein